jgi:ATP-dependent protease HslVU (ClpYQ) ATPase subunit
MENKSEE